MIARVRRLRTSFAETFWLVPGLLVASGVIGAVMLVEADRNGIVPSAFLESPWLYNGGSTGARTLLGAVASSTIGVAGTVFSITIAALSLTAGQMGPRLLRSFTKDRGNQLTLGVFLGTFAYALMVLRAVRDRNEGAFVPHLALSCAIAFSLICVATLVYFVNHMASRINVDTVIELVSADMRAAFARLTTETAPPEAPPRLPHADAAAVVDRRRGYLCELDANALAAWAAKNGTCVCLAVRLGDYVFPGAPIAVVMPPVRGAGDAIVQATVLSPERASPQDLEVGVRQLVEIAVRALSPGINDPMTAISVIDRLGAALCDFAPRYLRTGIHERHGRLVLVVPSIDYDALVDTMFSMIRQNGASSAAVLIRMLEVLTAVVRCETASPRVAAIVRHADRIAAAARRELADGDDLDDVIARREAFGRVLDRSAIEGIVAPHCVAAD